MTSPLIDTVCTGGGDLPAFLKAHRPSAGNEAAGPWYWIKNEEAKSESYTAEDEAAFIAAGEEPKKVLRDELARIKIEAPVRGSKAKGLRSQADLRRGAFDVFHKSIETLAKEHKILSGKWLYLHSNEVIDQTWSTIVHALGDAGGALKKSAGCYTAKASSAPEPGKDLNTICVYVADSFNKGMVGDVLRTLVKELKLVPGSYKTDAMTLLGIYSGDFAEMKTSTYVPKDFMPESEIKAIKEEIQATIQAALPTVKRKTLAEEQAEGGGFDEVSDSDEEKPAKVKRAKKEA